VVDLYSGDEDTHHLHSVSSRAATWKEGHTFQHQLLSVWPSHGEEQTPEHKPLMLRPSGSCPLRRGNKNILSRHNENRKTGDWQYNRSGTTVQFAALTL
jgi:hypothetical protein